MAPPHPTRNAGRSNNTTLFSSGSTLPSSVPSLNKPSLSVSTRNLVTPSFGNAAVADGLGASVETYRNSSGSRSTKRNGDMTSYTYTPSSPVSASVTSKPNHAKLHKRGGSGSSIPNASTPVQSHSHFTTPFATYEDPFPDVSLVLTSTQSSTPKLKPYLRKMSTSTSKEDQGQLDLSKSYADNEQLTGLGIQDFMVSRAASDVTFVHNSRKQPHVRNTSVGSHMSTGSGTLRPTQTFTHPMKQVPRPYTPPMGTTSVSNVHPDEGSESADVFEDDFRPGGGFRPRRSVSISSTHQNQPTPLSQSHTASDLALLPKLTSASTSNLSIRSVQSSKSKQGGRRGDNERSMDLAQSPSSRTSFDKAISFVSRRSETDQQLPQTRDERILAARRKFEAKEAHKDRKHELGALKRRGTDESKSVRQERPSRSSDADSRPLKPAIKQGSSSDSSTSLKAVNPEKTRKKSLGAAVAGAQQETERIPTKSYEQYRPTNTASLPRHGREAGASEKTPSSAHGRKPMFEHTVRNSEHGADNSWLRFSTWFQTRMLSCGKG